MNNLACFVIHRACCGTISCAGVLDRLVPESLDGNGTIQPERKYRDDAALRLFDYDPMLSSALDEFRLGMAIDSRPGWTHETFK